MYSKKINIYNSLTGSKTPFQPIAPPYVGMYVCGPTVYNDVHLGNVRTFTSFDVVYRYLVYTGHKVRYVRNITDVGHLEGDADIGREDKIAKMARLSQLEPMEITQKYTIGFHKMMDIFNNLPPSIEPRAAGHIIEQIKMVQAIIDNGYAYTQNGSVYFDTIKFAKAHNNYGQLSGRKIDDLLAETRDNLKNQDEKRHPSDFAIWIKADETHIMRWDSPWSVGFPGWHLECSAMSTKYLGETFDIHGGGNDLKFPHHENEIAQNQGACGCQPAKVWMHANMLLLNGRKMSKSEDNSITPEQLFTGDSPHISKAYSPMTLRFFMLGAHYRSTLDLTNEALLAAEKGYRRLMEAWSALENMAHKAQEAPASEDGPINELLDLAFADMDDDFNTPQALSRLFGLANKINSLKDGHLDIKNISASTFARLKTDFSVLLRDILGLKDDITAAAAADNGTLDGVMQLLIELRQHARANKDWPTSDKIRDGLNTLGIQLKDGKDGSAWSKQ
jgi:cysteinyl-tRNA synthetase